MSTSSHTRDFDNIINFRDVGYTVNTFLGKKLVKEGLLYRSARPDDGTLRDRRTLKDEYGIRTVMDLRTKTEHLNQAKKRNADLKVPALVQSNAALAEPVQIPGMRYLEIRLTGKSFERYLISQLSWWSYIKLIVLFVLGFRMKAIAIMGREVMLPRGLVGLGLDTIDNSTAEVAEALKAVIDTGNLPMMVHCTQGKDRTGIVISLVLMILDVPLNAIDYDYMLSGPELVPEMPVRLKEIREIGLTDEFGDVSPAMIEKTAQHLSDKYGGLEAYLDGIGFVEAEREKLRDTLRY